LKVRVSAGPLAEISESRCQSIGDGQAVVVRVGGEVVAFPNRCLHQNSPLEGGLVLNGTLICPFHFWRYRLPAGHHVGTDVHLPRFPVETVNGEVFVEVPDPQPAISIREMLLRHAREWKPGS
jgi:nitrite reductase/ring-hydroxylating ferredoxin subunit